MRAQTLGRVLLGSATVGAGVLLSRRGRREESSELATEEVEVLG